MKKIMMITGGSRSGKSNYALQLAQAYQNKAFLATAEAMDDEMRERIHQHQQDRGSDFLTLEEPLDIAKTLLHLPSTIEVAVIDCLTVWLGNLMYHRTEKAGTFPEISEFLKVITDPLCDLIIVSNEIGMGIVPSDALSRKFRDYAGRLNQETAQIAHQVYLTVSGIPLKLK
ncbi:bifunctional adenosylcobinamide kinase/adenosylcobinamide-phosphate guanylyltransferase [Deltaproteobacteria bacterium TL4]